MSSTHIFTSIGILLAMLILSFLFSGSEIAFLSASRLKIELKLKQGSTAARLLSAFKNKKEEIIIAILIGNNIALVLFTHTWEDLTAPVLAQLLNSTPEANLLVFTLIQTVVATLIVLVFAEYIPKALFRQNSDQIVFPLAYFLNLIYYLFYLPIWLTNGISKFILRYLFRVATGEKIVELGKKDLDMYIQEVLDASEHQPVPDLDTDMLSNALSLKDTKARECMIPRTEIEGVSIDTPVEALMDKFIETQLSKLIVFGENMDEVRGFVHSNVMFRDPEDIPSVLQPVLVVPETMPVNVLLAEFTENQRSVAIVVDEFGGTSGMITMEDLIEEVFGEIEDEHDQDKQVVEEDMICMKLEDGSFMLGARLEIDDLNENPDLEITLPDEEYFTTLGGMILYYAEDIPKKGQKVRIGNYIITIEKATRKRIIKVHLKELVV